jgi:FMN reductase (NADPH)/FMN reductase [NAD(P)H]
MSKTFEILMNRKSVRAFEDRAISKEIKSSIIQGAIRAPTAGNMMLYSIIEVSDQAIKETLVKTCDNQPFIARAPMVWVFLADYQRWYDYFIHSGVPKLCEHKNLPLRTPEEGDLFLACCDALIAAQNAVIAAESFGLGSCYIGDIMENYETHKELFDLPQYVFPICMLVFGYPTRQQKNREMTSRFDEKFIVFDNKYRRHSSQDLDEMYGHLQDRIPKGKAMEGISNFGQYMYTRKFSSDFSVEMSRSVRAMLKVWTGFE